MTASRWLRAFSSTQPKHTYHQVYVEGGSSEKLIAGDIADEDASLGGHAVASRRRQCVPISTQSFHCYTFLGLLGCIAMACIIVSAIFQFQLTKTSSPIPPISTHTITLQRKPLFEQPLSPESDRAWESQIPGGQGFILIPSPEKYNLLPGLSSGATANDTAMYGVTWAHEYHCLKMIRFEFWALIRGTSALTSDKTLSEKDEERLEHMGHCFDYLRQLIQCHGDTTVEWASDELTEEGIRVKINGYGVPHQCKNWDELYDHMKGNLPVFDT